MVDKVKIAVAALLVIAGIVTFHYFAEAMTILRVLAVLGGLAGAALVLWTTAPGKQFFAYAQDSVEETKKVVWPTRKETLQTTGIVFVFVLIMALFLWMVDASLIWVVKKLIGRGE